jgi:hypothetical protein
MAKPIPKKPKISSKPSVRKKKHSTSEISEELPKKKVKLTPEAKSWLEELERRAEERFKWADGLRKIQPQEAQVAINRMVAKMAQMAGEPKFSYDGAMYPIEKERLRKIQYYNHLNNAMRILVACAEWDIRIANFKAPKKHCLRCGKKVKKK